jgi:hypothetical protein
LNEPDRLFSDFYWLVSEERVGARLAGMTEQIDRLYPQSLSNGRLCVQIWATLAGLPSGNSHIRDPQTAS